MQRIQTVSDLDMSVRQSQHHIPNCTFLSFFKKSLKTNSENHLVKLSILFTLFSNRFGIGSMKVGKIIMISGIVIIIMGLIFHLQGQSIVGPESSFMYSNPQWVTYGIQIMVIGGVIAALGIVFNFIKRS